MSKETGIAASKTDTAISFDVDKLVQLGWNRLISSDKFKEYASNKVDFVHDLVVRYLKRMFGDVWIVIIKALYSTGENSDLLEKADVVIRVKKT